MKNFIHILSHLVFWVWNLTFIGLMYIWFLPQFGFDIWRDTRLGFIDPTFTVSFAALMVVPLVCAALGFFRLRKYPVLLMRLFYGVEAPLFTLCLLRLFLIRELTLASGVLLGLVGVAIATFAIELLTGYSAYRPRLAKVQMVSHSLILLVGLYVGTLLLLYTLPISFSAVVGFFRFEWVSLLGYMLRDIGNIFRYPIQTVVTVLFAFLRIFSAIVFAAMPYAFVNFYVRSWARIRTAFGKQHGQSKSWAITGITLAVSCLLFIAVQGQPQVKAFNLLATADIASQTPEQQIASRQTQLQNAPAIESGLTNAYLHRYRYLSPWARSNHLREMYRATFGLPRTGAQFVQNIHNGLISPFLYRGKDGDAERAAELYAEFFDTPIQKAQQPAIRKALQATANRDETEAGLLNLDQQVVRLAKQTVTVAEKGDWATVEIQEQYENLTIEDQEIFYSFSLPESAAISGLWLGTAESPQLFESVVSPRGAAQQVYQGEVERAKFQRATDPALLEQVGPRQYRLRVFPIPASSFEGDNRSQQVPGELYMTMRYEVMQQDGVWPLPQLTEKRNIFWTAETAHLRGEETVTLAEDEWFEGAIAAKSTPAQSHTVDLAEGYQVTATPLTAQQQRLTGQRLAIVVDTSYSMGQHTEALKQAVQPLEGVSLDFYLASADPIAGATPTAESAIDIDKTQFYGSLQPADMLQQFAAQRGDRAYDAVLLLTDEGSYELASDQAAVPELNAPLWMVHVDGKVPSAYEDGLLQQIQASRGGVETEVAAVLQRMAQTSDEAIALDGYLWTVEPKPADSAAADTGDKFEAIAARQLIQQQSRQVDVTQVAALDAVQAIAKRTHIVTPYSSMLVLVDERQRELLRAAEAGEDRFDREVEDGQNDLTQPGNPLASVPEPGQVLGLMVGAIALIFLKRRSQVAR